MKGLPQWGPVNGDFSKSTPYGPRPVPPTALACGQGQKPREVEFYGPVACQVPIRGRAWWGGFCKLCTAFIFSGFYAGSYFSRFLSFPVLIFSGKEIETLQQLRKYARSSHEHATPVYNWILAHKNAEKDMVGGWANLADSTPPRWILNT